MGLIERIEADLSNALMERGVANAEGRRDAPSVTDMAKRAAALADDHYRGAVSTALDAMEADAQCRLDAGDAPMVAAADLDALARVRRLMLDTDAGA